MLSRERAGSRFCGGRRAGWRGPPLRLPVRPRCWHTGTGRRQAWAPAFVGGPQSVGRGARLLALVRVVSCSAPRARDSAFSVPGCSVRPASSPRTGDCLPGPCGGPSLFLGRLTGLSEQCSTWHTRPALSGDPLSTPPPPPPVRVPPPEDPPGMWVLGRRAAPLAGSVRVQLPAPRRVLQQPSDGLERGSGPRGSWREEVWGGQCLCPHGTLCGQCCRGDTGASRFSASWCPGSGRPLTCGRRPSDTGPLRQARGLSLEVVRGASGRGLGRGRGGGSRRMGSRGGEGLGLPVRSRR